MYRARSGLKPWADNENLSEANVTTRLPRVASHRNATSACLSWLIGFSPVFQRRAISRDRIAWI